MKVQNDGKCRFCDQQLETIDHLISQCPILAKHEYLKRHNRVAQYVHWQLCKFYKLEAKETWYDHETPPVIENSEVTILWDFPINTDRTITANRPDIVIRNKIKKCVTTAIKS